MMEMTAICPYFERERGGVTYCEACRFRFKDTEMRESFLSRYCASFDYKDCPICRHLDEHYDRKERRTSNARERIEII